MQVWTAVPFDRPNDEKKNKNDRYQRTDYKGDKRRVGEKGDGVGLF
jgi:hypothetical protein